MFIFVFVNDFVAEEEKLRLQLARSLVPGFCEINENGVILLCVNTVIQSVFF